MSVRLNMVSIRNNWYVKSIVFLFFFFGEEKDCIHYSRMF